MRIPAWRLALTGAAIVILLVAGVSLVAASTNPGSAPNAAASVPNAPNPSAASRPLAKHPALQRILQRIASQPAARRLVDGQLTFVGPDGSLVTVQVDHGTIDHLATGSLVIDEAGGRQVTVTTDSATIVRLGGGAGVGKLSDLQAGDEVIVQSRETNGSMVAQRVLRVPAPSPAPAASPATGS